MLRGPLLGILLCRAYDSVFTVSVVGKISTGDDARGAGRITIDEGAERRGIDCEQSMVDKGTTMTVTVRVQAEEPGPQSSKFAVKAKLTISYPGMGGIEESDEEITVIYSGK